MIGKQSKNLALLAFLLASSVISGCNDSSSIREFGTSALSQGSSGTENEELPPTVEFDGSSLASGEFLAAEFAFSTGAASNLWIEAALISGPNVEIFLLDEISAESWSTLVSGGGDLSTFTFPSLYPDLEGILSGTMNTSKVIVTEGFYNLIIDNTNAGNIDPQTPAEDSVIDLRLYVESLTADGTIGDARMISISKVRVASQKK